MHLMVSCRVKSSRAAWAALRRWAEVRCLLDMPILSHRFGVARPGHAFVARGPCRLVGSFLGRLQGPALFRRDILPARFERFSGAGPFLKRLGNFVLRWP